MLIADVNILIGAHRFVDPDSDALDAWLRDQLSGSEPFGVSELVLSAFVRVVTNHRAFPNATPPETALEFCEVVRTSPAARVVAPGERHWRLFDSLVRETHATANLVPDAYLAALAIENGATFVTRDRGFRRFPGLRLLDPLAE